MITRTTLGSPGLTVSAMGLGCMGMSESHGAADWDGGLATIDRALELGVTFLDTADAYGTGHNEVLVGRAVHGRRDQVQLATKFGIDPSAGDRARRVRGARDYVLRSCDASLLRLGVEAIDLYYAHRPPQDVEIEETVGAMAELGVGLVPYAPLGRGFLTGTLDRSALGGKDFRRTNPRFAGEAGRANEKIAQTVREVADRLGATPAQVALAWVHAQAERLGVAVATIPGTRSPARLEQNAAAQELTLDADALAALDPLSDQVTGERYTPAHTAEVARG
ncbi:aldo/keto reductase [Streptomyces alboflavus]|uniref:aldo/keto reductase n=1 Tax=Streptomyces alboflavus TaxID=67267 RepID=UPI0036D1E8C0